MTYDIGDLVTLTGRFYSDAAMTVPADPTTVVLSIRDPNGAVTTPTPTHSGTGVYTYAWTPVLRGLHDVRWAGTGVLVSASQESIFILEDLTLAQDLCTIADVKLAVGIPSTTTTSDALIQVLVSAATRAFAARFQREFVPPSGNPLTRRFRVDGNIVDLAPYDLQAATLVSLDPAGTPTTLTSGTDYKLKPTPSMTGTYYKLHIADSRYLYSQTVSDYGYAELDITGTWGFASIPVDVARAATLTAAAWLDKGADQIAGYDNTARNDGSTYATSWAIPAAAYRLMQPYARVIP